MADTTQIENLPVPEDALPDAPGETLPLESDFGMGFTYSLGLFLKHAERSTHYDKPPYGSWNDLATSWMDGAYDHLYEVVLPPAMQETKWQMKFERIVEDASKFRIRWPSDHADLTGQSDLILFIHEFSLRVEELLMEADRLLGVEPVKAQWN